MKEPGEKIQAGVPWISGGMFRGIDHGPKPKPFKDSRPPENHSRQSQRRGQTGRKHDRPQAMNPPLFLFPRAAGGEEAKSEQAEEGPRLFHQACHAQQKAAAKERRGLSRILAPQQQQQAGQRRHDDKLRRMRRQPQHDWTRREQGIRGGGRDRAWHIQETPRQPVKQQDAREIHQQQTEVDARVALAKNGQQQGIGRINPREFHVVKQLVGGNALQDQLPGVGKLALVAFQRNCQ